MTLISMARPFLADEEFVNKAAQGKSSTINTCIACNQGCLDRVFKGQRASCLVNPRACYETELVYTKTTQQKKVLIVGLGPAGLACASVAAERGHQVIAYDAAEPGGQLNLAVKIPGKQEFCETLRYFKNQLEQYHVELHAHTSVSAEMVRRLRADVIVLATGVKPRSIDLDGIDHASVVSYVDVVSGAVVPGHRVAIIGSGGIGFDVAELLAHDKEVSPTHNQWLEGWGIDPAYQSPGGLLNNGVSTGVKSSARKIFLLQRKSGKPGAKLGKTTGWIHRLSMRRAEVETLSAVEYVRIDDQGLHIIHEGHQRCLAVDHIIVCAGQHPERTLFNELDDIGVPIYTIGGCDEALELDAERAIRQGAELAASL